jgi:putative transposase
LTPSLPWRFWGGIGVQQLGVERMSKSQVSRLAKSLDGIVEDFRTRPLDGAAYAYVTLDALVVKCREGGRTVNVCVVHAVGVNKDGFRESLGLDVVTSEDGAAWLAFIRGVARGLSGVRLVSSDAHPGLVDAIAATLPGACWQRCRTHFMRNLLTRVPKSAQGFVATMIRTIFAQPDAATVHEQHARIVAQLEDRFPEAAALLEEAGPDLLAFASFPKEHSTACRYRVPVKQALYLQTKTLSLIEACRCADVPRPTAERVRAATLQGERES